MRGCWSIGSLCLTLMLAGCGGGAEVVHDPDQLPVSCVSKVGAGTCLPGFGRYYYDYQSDRCRSTRSTHCGGRRIFDTLEECVRFCGARP